jgi:glycosyltransferase involved in cell wall biosynthesis
MIAVSHPTGNEFVRALLAALNDEALLHSFHTTIAAPLWSARLPRSLRGEMERRAYAIPRGKIHTHPFRETIRLAASKLGATFLTRHENDFASPDAVYRALDLAVANWLRKQSDVASVHCYEDGALETFRAARESGIRCVYELPIVFWQTAQRLLREEAERLPRWAATLGGNMDSAEKLERKSQEIALADVVICPSRNVLDSLPKEIVATKKCVIAEFGSPVFDDDPPRVTGDVLRVLFAGAMTQRKGLADVFAAMKLLARRDVQLVVLGTPVAPMNFYRSEFPDFLHEPPRAHRDVLALMRTCDVLLLPSIVEGRALVQQEAMSCGLPLIVTASAGGADLIDEGRTGFLVPIRAPEKIAEKIAWLADHRDEIPAMRQAARAKAAALTWHGYARKIIDSSVS